VPYTCGFVDEVRVQVTRADDAGGTLMMMLAARHAVLQMNDEQC